MLWVFPFIKPKVGDQFFAQMATTPLSEERVLRVQLHAPHVRVFLLSLSTNAHVTSGHTFYRAIIIEQQFGSGKAWVDLNAHIFGLLSKPTADVTHGNDVIAIVVNRSRQEQIWNLRSRFPRSVVVEDVLGHFGVQW